LKRGWAIIEEVWTRTLERTTRLPEPLLHQRIDGEWSFVDRLRHLIFATDTWLYRMVRHE
jgi:DinB superfamily